MRCVALRPGLQESKGPLNATGLIAVHTTRDKRRWLASVPLARSGGEERVSLGGVGKCAVLLDIKALLQGL